MLHLIKNYGFSAFHCIYILQKYSGQNAFCSMLRSGAEMIGIGKARFRATYHNKTVKNIGLVMAIAF